MAIHYGHHYMPPVMDLPPNDALVPGRGPISNAHVVDPTWMSYNNQAAQAATLRVALLNALAGHGAEATPAPVVSGHAVHHAAPHTLPRGAHSLRLALLAALAAGARHPADGFSLVPPPSDGWSLAGGSAGGWSYA